MTGSLGALNLNQRVAGFEAGLNDGNKFVRVALEASDDNADTALSQAESILRGHPNLRLIFCSTGTGTPQAAKAVKEAGLGTQVMVVGFDALDDTLQGRARWLCEIHYRSAAVLDGPTCGSILKRPSPGPSGARHHGYGAQQWSRKRMWTVTRQVIEIRLRA